MDMNVAMNALPSVMDMLSVAGLESEYGLAARLARGLSSALERKRGVDRYSRLGSVSFQLVLRVWQAFSN